VIKVLLASLVHLVGRAAKSALLALRVLPDLGLVMLAQQGASVLQVKVSAHLVQQVALVELAPPKEVVVSALVGLGVMQAWTFARNVKLVRSACQGLQVVHNALQVQ
jgi:HD-like signal output (HDOD) protein